MKIAAMLPGWNVCRIMQNVISIANMLLKRRELMRSSTWVLLSSAIRYTVKAAHESAIPRLNNPSVKKCGMSCQRPYSASQKSGSPTDIFAGWGRSIHTTAASTPTMGSVIWLVAIVFWNCNIETQKRAMLKTNFLQS